MVTLDRMPETIASSLWSYLSIDLSLHIFINIYTYIYVHIHIYTGDADATHFGFEHWRLTPRLVKRIFAPALLKVISPKLLA